MQAVILAGGQGTRLGSLTEGLPKPMVRLGGRPLLEYQVRLLRKYHVRDVIISTGYLADRIEEYFKDGRDFGVSIRYAREDRPLGTAGALKELEGELRDDFLVLYGDVMLDMDLARLVRFHRDKGGAGTLVLHPNDHPQDSDLVEIDADSRRVIAFHPKPHPPGRYFRNLVNAGAYVLSPRVLPHLEKGVKADLGRDTFPRLVAGESLFGYVTAEYLKDMGTPERLAQVTEDFWSGKVKRLNGERRRRAIFLDRDGVLNRHVGLVHRPEDLELLPDVADGIRAINRSDFLAIVVTNQPVVARNLCSPEELEQIHGRMEALLAERGAKLDAIYHCPHHPDRGYPGENPRYKVPCDCRKPGTGMVRRAADDFNIRLEGSFLIGDSVRDVRCGQRAGLATIAVMTGERWTAWDCEPDYVFPTFRRAVEFVLHDPFRHAFQRLHEEFFAAADRRPFVLTVDGGLHSEARNFASYVARSFQQRGHRALCVSYNECLLRAVKAGGRARDRAALDGLLSDSPESGKVSAALAGARNGRHDAVSPAVLVIHGEPPAGLERLRERSQFRVYCDFDEAVVETKQRRFLAWRGFEPGEIEAVRRAQRGERGAAPARNADMLVAPGVV